MSITFCLVGSAGMDLWHQQIKKTILWMSAWFYVCSLPVRWLDCFQSVRLNSKWANWIHNWGQYLTGPHGVGISSWCLGLRFGDGTSDVSRVWLPNSGLKHTWSTLAFAVRGWLAVTAKANYLNVFYLIIWKEKWENTKSHMYPKAWM